MEEYRIIEKSIIKKYNLIEENDKIAVCISGGKDGFLLAKCLDELKRHGIFKFDLVFITLNPGYNEENIKSIKKNANLLNIKLKIIDTEIFKIAKKHKKSPCYLCSKIRRGTLYSEAEKLGCNKIALGHHFNDVIETIMMNITFNGTFSSMLPIIKSDNFENIKLIRPLYNIEENDIIKWVNYNKLNFKNYECPIDNKKNISSRNKTKKTIEYLKNNYYKDFDKNLLKATENINQETLLNKIN